MSHVPDRPHLDFAGDLDFEQILTNPILDIGARVWDEDRYVAFRICYRSMRRIDDLVDDRKEGGKALTAQEITQYAGAMSQWLEALERGEAVDEFQEELLATIKHFCLPIWHWQRLCEAMVYDLTHDGFPNLLTFRRYAEGAAIAPASIFMHLCGLRRDGRRNLPPVFDVHRAASDLALFSYFTHIIRDFEKDLRRRLFYFADDLIARHGLTRDDLYASAISGDLSENLKSLIAQYRGFADFYRRRARTMLDSMPGVFEPQYRLSLEIIYALYLQVFERIDVTSGDLRAETLQPSPEEVRSRLLQTIDTHSPASR